MEDLLTGRQKQILNTVISAYISNAEPVSSSKLVMEYQLSVSSATVRNDLSVLEEHGFLDHPHTSAGRVPTDKGYRYYVNYLLGNKHLLEENELVSIKNLYHLLDEELEGLLRETSIVLSKLTKYAAVLMMPPHFNSTVKRVDLVKLSKMHILIVVIMSEGVILKNHIETSAPVKASDLANIENIINKHCVGAKGHELHKRAGRCFEEIKSKFKNDLVEKIFFALSPVKKKEKIIIEGTSHLLSHPEFFITNRIKELFDFFDEQLHLANLLTEVSKLEGLTVKIGSEFSTTYNDLSFIGRKFCSKSGSTGTLGILGPRRMNYARAITTVDRVANTLTDVLAKS